MRLRTGTAVIVLVGVLLVAGCATQPPPVAPSPSPGPTGPVDAWGQLAARVATAQDKRYVASYSLTVKNRPTRTVGVTVAADGSWLVTIPGAALGGTADVAVAATPSGLYQCALSPVAGTTTGTLTSPTPSTGTSPDTTTGSVQGAAGCVRVGDADATLPAPDDPRIEHLFTSWLPIMTDRDQAIAVNYATLKGAKGQCYSIEPNSAALTPPVDAGIYCYDTSGMLTAAALAMGTLTLAVGPTTPPATVALPAPVTGGQPIPTASPSAPPPVTQP